MKSIKIQQEQSNIVKELVGEIQYLNGEYRAGNPQVSDEEYDELIAKLASIDPENSILKRGIIEEQKDNSRKRKLPIPMMSMNKCKTFEELKSWIYSTLKKLNYSDEEIQNVELVLTPKYNGISLLYDSKNLEAFTRGDGEFGQKCDNHFLKMDINFSDAPDISDGTFTIGEAIIPTSIWEKEFKGKVSPTGLPYKLNNATVAGLFNCDEPSDMLQYVTFMKYGTPVLPLTNKVEQLEYLNDISTLKVDFLKLKFSDLTEDICDLIFKKNSKLLPIDGVVVEFNDRDIRNKLGREPNGNPAYARALKLDKWSEEKDTVITGYDFQISKQGKLKGVVTFDPVLINGTDVKQATFYNVKFIRKYCLFPGVNITVKKSGEVIPKIVAVEGIKLPTGSNSVEEYEVSKRIFETVKDKKFPSDQDIIKYFLSTFSTCPSCGCGLVDDDTFVERICSNPNCKDKLISKLEHFVTVLEIEEVGRPTIEAMFEAGINTCEKLYTVSKNDLANISGFGESTINTIVSQFTKVRERGISLAKLMYALDIFEGKIGEKTTQLIFDSLDIFLEENQTIDKLNKIKGVSDITAGVFLEGLEKISSNTLSLYNVNMVETIQIVPSGDKYHGFSVCFSGLRDKELEKVIIDNGGKISDSVSKNTTHLIVADINQHTSKTVKAKEIGIYIMSVEQFKSI